ncbi:DUF2326 domain-containing protein [Paenibacillus sp. FSL H7-0331]
MEKTALGISYTVADIVNAINNELAEELRNYKRQRSSQESKLKRIRNDLSNRESLNGQQFRKLTDFFPSVNLEKLKDIEKFHESITNILHDELIKAEKEISIELEYLQHKIAETEEKLTNIVANKSVSKEVIQPLIELSSVLYQKRNENTAYIKKLSVADDLKSTKEKLSLVKSEIIIEVCNIINNKIESFNQIVHKDGRRSPKIVLTEKNYSYGIEDNTGTGEAYTNLITFDLAILELTALPILIHDSMLFKNIENSSVENIIDIYNVFGKQIFISIDEIEKYSKETKKIIQSKKVLELTRTKLLFIKDWRKNK